MKDLLVAAILIAAGIVGLTNADQIRHLYAGAYPESAERQQALDRCAASSNGFDRLDSADRDSCYARIRVAAPTVQLLGPPSVPKEDIRRIQQTMH